MNDICSSLQAYVCLTCSYSYISTVSVVCTLKGQGHSSLSKPGHGLAYGNFASMLGHKLFSIDLKILNAGLHFLPLPVRDGYLAAVAAHTTHVVSAQTCCCCQTCLSTLSLPLIIANNNIMFNFKDITVLTERS